MALQTWFIWSGVPKAALLQEGQLDVPPMCMRYGMRPETLEIAGLEVAWSRQTGLSSNLPEVRNEQPGDGTKENPIQIHGISSQAAVPAAAGGGPPYLYRDLVKKILPPWQIVATSTSTHMVTLDGVKLVPWQLQDRDQIMDFVQRQCGDLQDEYPLYQGTAGQHISNENMCNVEFHTSFAQVAARMVSRMRPGVVITSELNAATIAVLGCPDFVFMKRGGITAEELLVGEGKSPSVMRSTSTIFLPEDSSIGEELKKCIEQEATYMFRRDRRYGFLTYLNGTFFIKRTSDLEFAVTDAISPSRRDPSVLEMLIYILLKQYDEGDWEVKCPRLRKRLRNLKSCDKDLVKKRQEEEEKLKQQQCGSGSSTRPNTRSVAKRKREYVDHSECDIAVFDECLGLGQTGSVRAGSVHGKDVALKATEQHVMMEQLQDEVDILEHLAPLQGGPVPQLVEYGFVQGMDVFFVATGICRGEHPYSSIRAALPAARKALTAIHNKGVLHGDVRAENVLVSKEEGTWKVTFIDFGLSTFSTDASHRAREMLELEQIFCYSEDDNMTGE